MKCIYKVIAEHHDGKKKGQTFVGREGLELAFINKLERVGVVEPTPAIKPLVDEAGEAPNVAKPAKAKAGRKPKS